MPEIKGVYPVHCNDCGRFLCEAPMNTATYCPKCNRWTRLEPEGSGEQEKDS